MPLPLDADEVTCKPIELAGCRIVVQVKGGTAPTSPARFTVKFAPSSIMQPIYILQVNEYLQNRSRFLREIMSPAQFLAISPPCESSATLVYN